jgi:pimeloyl-ACP methyl ester carboxylesterase
VMSRPRRSSSRVRRAALGLMALLALTSSAGAQSAPADPAAAGVFFEAEPCPFWSVEESARHRVECGKLHVPESEPGSRRYRLQVAILRSHGERLHHDPIVRVPGGPGDAMIYAVPQLAQHPLQDALRQHRDLVFFDPRGIGYSEPGDLCPGSEDMEARLGMLRLPFDERTAFVRRELAACRARLQEEGIDPAQFNSVALARDLEWLRQALGYDQLNLIGFSWGTRVVLETMRRFPGSVRSALLYGPVPPGSYVPGNAPSRAGPSLERLFAACETDPACRAAFPNIAEEFRTVLDELDANPIRLHLPGGPLDVDGSVAATVIVFALYDSEFLRYVPLAIRELGRRNAGFVEVLLRSVLGEGASGGFAYAAWCYELAPPLPPDAVQHLRDRYPWSARAQPLADETVVCDAFVAPSADPTVFEPVRSDVPTVIFVGEFDPATPPEYGQQVAATLPNSHLLVFRAKGHGFGGTTDCMARIRKALFDDPTQPPDARCIAELPPVSFATGVHPNGGVPRLMSRVAPAPDPIWLTGIGMLLAVLVAGAIAFPLGWIIRRRTSGPPAAALATVAIWGAAAVAVTFAAGLVVALRTADDQYVGLFGVPAAWGWLLVLPAAVIPLVAIGLIGVVAGWRQRWWTPRARVFRTAVTLAAVGFVWMALWVDLL